MWRSQSVPFPRRSQARSREAPRWGRPTPGCPVTTHTWARPGPPHPVGLPAGVSQGPGPARPFREACVRLAGWGGSTGKKVSLGGEPWLVLVVGLLESLFSTLKNVGSGVSRTLSLLLSENSCSVFLLSLFARRFPRPPPSLTPF